MPWKGRYAKGSGRRLVKKKPMSNRLRTYKVNKMLKRSVRQKPTVSIGLGLPKKMVVTHRYRQAYNHTSNAVGGTMTVANFAANGMWDCDLSGVGHQPLYFDQISPLYDHYCVIGSKIKVTLINVSSTIPFRFGIFLNDDTTTIPTAMDAIAEQPTGKEVYVPVGNGSKYVLTSKYSTKKTFGGSILGNIDLRGDSGSNPLEGSVYSLCMESILSAAQASAQVLIEIEYIAVWTELHDVGSS